MTLIADGLLLTVSLAAIFYCWSLNRRLSALKNTDEGVGASIKALADSVEQTRDALKTARKEAKDEEARLAQLVDTAKAARDGLDGVDEMRALLDAIRQGAQEEQQSLLGVIQEAREIEDRMAAAQKALDCIDSANVQAREAQGRLEEIVEKAETQTGELERLEAARAEASALAETLTSSIEESRDAALAKIEGCAAETHELLHTHSLGLVERAAVEGHQTAEALKA
ncbi:MAG: hypothetical protein AAFR16_09525, partial [Pseudomonadota bacterium]